MRLLSPSVTFLLLLIVDLAAMKVTATGVSRKSDQDVEHHEHAKHLPEARKMAAWALQRLGRFQSALSLLPIGLRIRVMRRRLDSHKEKFELFNSLPVQAQERILSRYLATMDESVETAFRQNDEVFSDVGFRFRAKRVLGKAEKIRRKLIEKKRQKKRNKV